MRKEGASTRLIKSFLTQVMGRSHSHTLIITGKNCLMKNALIRESQEFIRRNLSTKTPGYVGGNSRFFGEYICEAVVNDP